MKASNVWGICVNHRFLCKDSWHPGRYSNLVPLQYKWEVLSVEQTSLWNSNSKNCRFILERILHNCEAICHSPNIESDSSVIYVMHFLKALAIKNCYAFFAHTVNEYLRSHKASEIFVHVSACLISETNEEISIVFDNSGACIQTCWLVLPQMYA
jgi:hypothetical protein